MAWGQVAHVANTVTGPTATGATDTTGANIILTGSDGGGTLSGICAAPADSKSNSYTALTDYDNGANVDARLCYAANPAVGSGHTFTPANANDDIIAVAFSGSATSSPFEGHQNGLADTAPFTTDIDPGSITPGVNGCLIISNVAMVGGGLTAPPGFTGVDVRDFTGSGYRLGSGVAWLEQGTAASISAPWDWSTNVLSERAGAIAAFKPPGSGVSATSAQVLPHAVQAGAGAEKFTATSAQTLKHVTQSGAGGEKFSGTSAQILAHAVQSGVGLEQPKGAAASILPHATQSGAGAEAISGLSSQTLPHSVQAGVGIEQPKAAAAQTLAHVTQAGTGAERMTGTSAETLPHVTQAGAAIGATGTAGSGAQTLAHVRQSGTGIEQPKGVAAQTLAHILQSASGAERMTATASSILPHARQAGASVLKIIGTGGNRLAAIVQSGTGVGTLFVIGTAAQILPHLRQSAVADGGIVRILKSVAWEIIVPTVTVEIEAP